MWAPFPPFDHPHPGKGSHNFSSRWPFKRACVFNAKYGMGTVCLSAPPLSTSLTRFFVADYCRGFDRRQRPSLGASIRVL